MSTKFTPGPWVASEYDQASDEICIYGEGEEYVCSIDCDGVYEGHTARRIDANAHLIKAATGLYDVCELVAKLPIRDHLPDDVPVTGVDGFYITQGDVKNARATLAKARGES